MTIGDVLATVTFLAGAGASWWALLVCSALLCRDRTAPARAALEARPWRTLGRGALVLVVGLGLAALLANLPNGALKLLAWLVLGAMLALAALGGGALSLSLSERMQGWAPQLSPLSGLCRAAGLLVGAQFVPAFGWFLLAPLTFTLALGLGYQALRRPRAATSSLAQLIPEQPSASGLASSAPLRAEAQP